MKKFFAAALVFSAAFIFAGCAFMQKKDRAVLEELGRDELRDYLTRLDMRFETINDKLNRLLPPSALDPSNDSHASPL